MMKSETGPEYFLRGWLLALINRIAYAVYRFLFERIPFLVLLGVVRSSSPSTAAVNYRAMASKTWHQMQDFAYAITWVHAIIAITLIGPGLVCVGLAIFENYPGFAWIVLIIAAIVVSDFNVLTQAWN